MLQAASPTASVGSLRAVKSAYGRETRAYFGGTVPVPVTIRRARESDMPVLRAVYRDAVEAIGPRAYTREQTAAWARTADTEALAETVLGGVTFAAELEGRIAGFCTYEPDGRIALLYVRGADAGRGIGRALLATAIEHARRAGIETFHAEASELSLPLFEKLRFVLVERERSRWNGVEFVRYRVRREA